jgi:hypothetical protein
MENEMSFQKAVRKNARLRLALTGASGSGKTWSALALATGLGGKIAVIDTEHDSASLYAEHFDFCTQSIAPPYKPERFIQAIKDAEAADFNVLIIDSLSHEWNGAGGCLEANDQLAASKYKGNSWSAWNETTPRHRALLDVMLASHLHIIVTLRSKTETVQSEGKRVIKLGMKSEMRDGFEYEFTTVLDISHESHVAIASKDRTGLFTGADPKQITADTGKMLMAWLNKGAPLPPISAERFNSAIEKLKSGEITAGVILANFTLNPEQTIIFDDAKYHFEAQGAIQ